MHSRAQATCVRFSKRAFSYRARDIDATARFFNLHFFSHIYALYHRDDSPLETIMHDRFSIFRLSVYDPQHSQRFLQLRIPRTFTNEFSRVFVDQSSFATDCMLLSFMQSHFFPADDALRLASTATGWDRLRSPKDARAHALERMVEGVRGRRI